MKRSSQLTPDDRLNLAKESIDNGADPAYAVAHALIALTEAIISSLERVKAEQ